MRRPELLKLVKELFQVPDPITVAGLRGYIRSAGEEVTIEQVHAVCEQLREEGVLVRTDRQTDTAKHRYAADPQWFEDEEAEHLYRVGQTIKELSA
jgi:hypothetical protein